MIYIKIGEKYYSFNSKEKLYSFVLDSLKNRLLSPSDIQSFIILSKEEYQLEMLCH